MDYAFGLVDELDSRHRVSVGLRFGENRGQQEMVKRPVPVRKQQVVLTTDPKLTPHENTRPENLNQTTRKFVKTNNKMNSKQKIYTVKPGDTLSKISRRVYGNSQAWRKIYQANKHLLDNPRELVANQKLVLP